MEEVRQRFREANRRCYRKHKKRRLEKNREHYWQHREEILQKQREYRRKNPEKQRELHRKWREKNKEHLRIYAREYARKLRREHPEKLNEKQQQHYIRCRQEVLNLFNRTCAFCQKSIAFDERFVIHEINGIKHPDFNCREKRDREFIKKNQNRFVLVHFDCHKTIHTLMERFRVNWEQIILCINKLHSGGNK